MVEKKSFWIRREKKWSAVMKRNNNRIPENVQSRKVVWTRINISHNMDRRIAGIVIVLLLSVISSGCTTSHEKEDKPIAMITLFDDDIRKDESISLSGNMSLPSKGTISHYLWDFGDGNTYSTNETSVFHSYDDAGFYDVILIVKDRSGQSDPANITIKVKPHDRYSNRTQDHEIIAPQESVTFSDAILVENLSYLVSFNISAENHFGEDVWYHLQFHDPNDTKLSTVNFNVSGSSKHMSYRGFYNQTLSGNYILRTTITNNGLDPADTTSL